MTALKKEFSENISRREKLNYILDTIDTFDCVEIEFVECLGLKNFVLPYKNGGNADLISAELLFESIDSGNVIINFYSYSKGIKAQNEFFIDAIKSISFWNKEKEAEKPSIADMLDKDFKKFQEIFARKIQEKVIANIINQSGKDSK